MKYQKSRMIIGVLSSLSVTALFLAYVVPSKAHATQALESMSGQSARSVLFNTNHGRILRFTDPDNGNVCYAPLHIRVENGKEAYSHAVGWSCLPPPVQGKKK